jgi:cellulose synthase/poly-beta-1,6-N-acetylglucosamine synthase-like glycosyltransferase
MLIELFIFAIVLVAYGTFTTIAIIGIGRLKQGLNSHSVMPTPLFISIIISARNEAEHIEECISQLIKQHYPTNQYELILMDDASDDNTYELAKRMLEKTNLDYRLIKQTAHQGKKENFVEAITLAKGDVIVTSDADVCYRHENWLTAISNYFAKYQPNLLIMPIDFETQSGLLSNFQILENIALTGITAGYAGQNSAFMCNGANLAFKKSAYSLVNGYQSHIDISSGEDVFLLEDLKKLNHKGIHYLLHRDVIVKTKPQKRLKDFIDQRVRWAYKAKYNSNHLNRVVGFIVISANLIFVAIFVAIFRNSVFTTYLAIFAIAKLLFDFLLLFLASDFLGRTKYIWWLVPFECIYWIYALFIGTISLFWKPYWKGKKIN